MAKKIPLNVMLEALDRQDFDWYSNLSADDKKAWSSWLTLRYASVAKGSYEGEALLRTNEFVNKHYSDLYKEDDLMWRLFCLTGSGKKQFHKWIKAPNSRKTTDKVESFVREHFPYLKDDEIELFMQLNSTDDIRGMAVDIGLSDKEVKEIFDKKAKKK